MFIYDYNKVEGKEILLLYWRRPEDENFTRCAFYLTTKGLERQKEQMEKFGLICARGKLTIPPVPIQR